MSGKIRGIERGVVGIHHAQLGGVAPVPDVAADGCTGAAGARADHDPRWQRVLFVMHLGEDRLGDVVVTAPVGGSFGIGELV
ncbi:Uncharacterised protein [Mycobacteroides abscessus subsp. abscessus]|nr:Uncharacterised protein [Mycobacteroides abscessus subsp. abscessus]